MTEGQKGMEVQQSVPTAASGRQVPARTRRKAQSVTQAIARVKQEARRTEEVSRQEIEDVAQRYAQMPSSVLVGIVGGVAGTVGGVALSTAVGGLLIVTGPLGLAAGAATAILLFRGRKLWQLENDTSKVKGSTEVLKAGITNLPSDAPEEIKKNWYRQYDALMTKYAQIALQSLDQEPNKQTVPTTEPH
jgi:hypothetical protein